MFRLAEMHTFTHPDIQKKAPQSRRRTAGQRVSMGSTLLGGKHEESCSVKISYLFCQVCQLINKMATKDRTLVAINLCIKELPEYLYQ